MSALQQAKLYLVENIHLAKDALHIYVALALVFGSCLLFGWKVRQWRPWLLVLAAALAGEAWDLRDTIAGGDPVHLAANVKDVLNTLAVSTLLLLLAARHTSWFDRTRSRGGKRSG